MNLRSWLLTTACCLLTLSLASAPLHAQRGSEAENLVSTANLIYRQALEQLDPDLFWDAVDTLYTLFNRFPESSLARDNYLTAAEICLKKIGTPEAHTTAKEIFQQYLRYYGASTQLDNDPRQLRNMHLALVQFHYLYRHDYPEAARELNRFYESYQAQILPSEQVQVKLAEARIQRKQGDFAAARRAYGIAEQASRMTPGSRSISMQTEIRFCDAVLGGTHVLDGSTAYHGLSGVSGAQLAAVQGRIRDAATELSLRLGVDPGIPLDVYVFPNANSLRDLTGQENPWVLAGDGELNLLPDTEPMPLLAQIWALGWQTRPVDEIPQVLAEGLPSTFGEMERVEIEAAGQRALLGSGFEPGVLLDSQQYAVLPEASALAAVFVERLIARYGIARFGRLYGGWEELQHVAPQPGSVTELNADPDRFLASTDVEAMGRAFRSVMGEELQVFWRSFANELQVIAKAEEEAFSRRSGGFRTVAINDTTPEETVHSWFAALAAGDTKALETLSIAALKTTLTETWKDFQAAGNFDAMRLWSLAIPYSETTHKIVAAQALGPAQVRVAVDLTRRGQPMQRQELLLYEEGGKWRMASGLE